MNFVLKNVGLITSMPHAQLIGVAIAIFSVCIASASLYFNRKPRGCLDPDKFKEFKLVKKTPISHNVARFRFALPTPKSVLGLPVGQHVVCRGKYSEGQEVIRPYTPITLDSDVGYFELVVKMYPKGKMSHHFRELSEGENLAVKGPKKNKLGNLENNAWFYICFNQFWPSFSKGRFKYRPGQARSFGMISGGSGITPIFQLSRSILENPKDKTKLNLTYANTTFEDILLKEELTGFASKFPDRFDVYYVLTQPPVTWTGGIGHVSKEIIKSHCSPPASDIQILMCGPPGMNKAMAAHLNALGYASAIIFEF